MSLAKQRLIVRGFMVSVDGYAAGENQRLDSPFGDNVEGFTDWIFATRSGNQMLGLDGGQDNEDEPFVANAFDNVGAVILGRNMFGVSRGPWTDDGWNGWWGPNPPYHCPTFVLTHHEREPMMMEGGTTFHFATAGIHETLARAFVAAEGKDVRLIGGAATISQYLAAELIDEFNMVIVPMFIGSGERPFPRMTPPPSYRCVQHIATASVMHLRFERKT